MSLRAETLTLRIPGRTLVDSLSLSLEPGSCCALLGRNGAGKSSLLLTLAGLRPAEGGAVFWKDRRIDGLSRTELAPHLGSLLQDEYESFWGSVRDYAALGALHRGSAWGGADADALRRADEALLRMDLGGHAGQPYRTLSAGERQRARIAQLLVQDARVLLLDEPLAHLDLGHQSMMAALLRELAAEGRALLVALHEPMWAARSCDRALLLYDSGRFVIGSAADVLTQDHLEALYGCKLRALGGAHGGQSGRPHDPTLLFPEA